MTHIPGPWYTFKSTDKHDWWVSDAPMSEDGGVGLGTNFVGTALWVGDQKATEANARLIAAAPELLEACQAAMAWLEMRTDGRIDLAETALRNAALPIRVAIAKAQGGAQ